MNLILQAAITRARRQLEPPAPARPQRIPRIIHQIWLGKKEMPAAFQKYSAEWRRLHPGFEYFLWTDGNLGPLGIREDACAAWNHACEPSELISIHSDVIRWTALLKYGGVYADTDMQPLRAVDDLVQDRTFVVAREDARFLGSAFAAAEPGHVVLRRMLDELYSSGINTNHGITYSGPGVLTKHATGVTVLPALTCYPYHYKELHRCNERFPHSHMVHRWSATWKA